MADNEIIREFEEALRKSYDIIVEKDAEIFNLNKEISALKLKNDEFLKSNEKAKAEIERLRGVQIQYVRAYFNEFVQRLKSDCSLALLDTDLLNKVIDDLVEAMEVDFGNISDFTALIKSEAYREFAKYLTKHIKDELEQCGNPNHDTQPIAYGTVLGLKSALSFVETAPIILESDVPDQTATSVSLIDGHIEG